LQRSVQKETEGKLSTILVLKTVGLVTLKDVRRGKEAKRQPKGPSRREELEKASGQYI